MTPIEHKDSTTNTISDTGNSTTYIATKDVVVRGGQPIPISRAKKIDRDQSKKLLKEIKKISKFNIHNRTAGFDKKRVFVRTGHR